ncbi:hypothetical protein ACIHFE_24695 [Streptomyces sp. NPDC052396]|uniref:hypothetical protein n=1 Tax=Streptomyces sp. NPDC052396 TaxID=3365689 RepID=UPI0037D8B3FD
MFTHSSSRRRLAALATGATLLVGAAGIATAATASATPRPAPAKVVKLTQSQAEAQLRAAGIKWWSPGHCSKRSSFQCTSFEQINKSTVQGIIAFKKASKCAITITGGTETGHATSKYSHYNGYKLDISPSSCLSAYIKGKFHYIGQRSDGYPQWKAPSGNLYCNEGNHWDITYFKAAP